MTGPRNRFANTSARADERRVRPQPSVDLHAHPVDEAVTLEEGLLAVTIDGVTSSGASHAAEVFLPHPFTFAMMKLFAFRDRFADQNKEQGRYHALDLYAVLATATEMEWAGALDFRDRYRDLPEVVETGEIVDDQFSSVTSSGSLRLRESAYWRPGLQLDAFLSALRELFPLSIPE